jgi:hypothetical protein
MTEEGTKLQESTKPAKTFAEFLQSTPPNTPEELVDVVEVIKVPSRNYRLADPDIWLHCDQASCEGERFFTSRKDSKTVLFDEEWKNCFVDYFCRNCRQRIKTFSLAVRRKGGSGAGQAMKYGELPEFGPPTPARVMTLIGPYREMFLQGRRAENQGLGIGSFAYYRRVVDEQKGRIIHEIAKASAKLGASKEMLEQLARAEKETQFSTAIDQIKAGIPAALLIHGQNPLTLLHSALSESLHGHTDKECLEIAQEIRLVLTELADRISQALKEEKEIKDAVSRLMNRNRKPQQT